MKEITSPQNTYIKQLVQLKDKSRERKKTGIFLIEGEREISLALKGGYELETVLFYRELFSEKKLNDFAPHLFDTIEISKDVYQKLAYRDTTEGILAVAKSKENDLTDLNFDKENPLVSC